MGSLQLLTWLLFQTMVLAGVPASSCPDWAQNSAAIAAMPECPEEATRLGPAGRFPVLAFIASDRAAASYGPPKRSPLPRIRLDGNTNNAEEGTDWDKDVGEAFVLDLAEKVLTSAPDTPPLLFLPVRAAAFARVQKHVLEMTEQNPTRRAAWTKALVHLKDIPKAGRSPRWTWQKDYFMPNVGARGEIALRPILPYDPSVEEWTPMVFKKMEDTCSLFRPGKPLEIPARRELFHPDWVSNFTGGNIVGGPQGTCIYGDNQSVEYAAGYCPNRKKHIQISTSWLKVGHADEIVLPLPKLSAKGGCDFFFLMPSTVIAKKLLQENRSEKFFSFFVSPNRVKTEGVARARLRAPGFSELCRMVVEYQSFKKKQLASPLLELPGMEGLGEGATLADAALPTLERCESITNSEVLDTLLHNEEWRVTHARVEERLARVRQTLQKKFPACKVEFVETPNLFLSSSLVPVTGASPAQPLEERYQLADRAVLSLLPSAANSQFIHKTLIVPHPQNATFARSIETAMAKQGIETSFIDTFDYAHVGSGDLGCVSQAIRWCRARPLR